MKDRNWKIVRQNKFNSDQHLLGFFNSENQAKDMLRKYDNKDELIIKQVNVEEITNPCCTDYMHYVWSLIPKEEQDRVMLSDASAEIEPNSLMCGGATYYHLSRMIPKEWTVIDIGCAYNAQSYLFQDHARHIAIEPCSEYEDFRFEYFKAPNTELLFMDGETFILEELPKLELDLRKTFCVSNYVPPKPIGIEKGIVAFPLLPLLSGS